MAGLGSFLSREFRLYQIWGANTDAGKTIFSTLLCRAAKKYSPSHNIWYLKPVSTGPAKEADIRHLDIHAKHTHTQNFYQFSEAVSPHIAARNHSITDEDVIRKLASQIRSNAQSGPGFMLVETAGGPHSPAPSGTSQAELFRPLRIPVIFVADYRLGGISTSISAFESLKMRGYDVAGAAIFRESTYQNSDHLKEFFKAQDVPLLQAPLPPMRANTDDIRSMNKYYEGIEQLTSHDSSQSVVGEFTEILSERHIKRIERLESMASTAHKHIWYPFTQHQGLKSNSLNVIDSAYGDYFQTQNVSSKLSSLTGQDNILQSTVDGSASWWTQGLGHANHALTTSAAYAAGRYGHVMFAEGVHEPALSLAERLLSILGNPRLQRVFYSDNGSTGMEVAVKMGLKASCVRYGWEKNVNDVEIIALKNSYHGDTLGAMDMSEPSVFNKKVPWYKGRGFFFDFPTVKMRSGKWIVEKPESLRNQLGNDTIHASLQDVFSIGRDSSGDAEAYEKYIRQTLQDLTQKEGRNFGALVMEPVVLGAGGMLLCDPLFQRTLVNVIRTSPEIFSPRQSQSSEDTNWRGLPIIADEVFTGLYRLGHATSCSLIHVHPDISVHAKLLTGGLLPLATTVASESIFSAFLSSQKADSLLHGHSYTAHAIGCAVANSSLDQLRQLDAGGRWDAFKSDWAGAGARPLLEELRSAFKDVAVNVLPREGSAVDDTAPPVWSVWSSAFVTALSHRSDRVEGVWALGSVLSIALRDEKGSGYTSGAAKTVQQRLLADDGAMGWNIHSRVLGNVLYLMASQVSAEEDVRRWERRVKQALDM